MRPYVNDHAIEAEMYLSRRSEMDSILKGNSVLNVAGIHRCASWNRDEAVSKRRPRKSRELSLTSGTARNLRLLKMATVARKNGAGDAPELKTAGSEPLRKSRWPRIDRLLLTGAMAH